MIVQGFNLTHAISQTEEALHATRSTEQVLDNLESSAKNTLADLPLLGNRLNLSNLNEIEKTMNRDKLSRARAALEQACFTADQGLAAAANAIFNGDAGMVKLRAAIKAMESGHEAQAMDHKDTALLHLGAAESLRKTAVFKMGRAGAGLLGGYELMRQVETALPAQASQDRRWQNQDSTAA